VPLNLSLEFNVKTILENNNIFLNGEGYAECSICECAFQLQKNNPHSALRHIFGKYTKSVLDCQYVQPDEIRKTHHFVKKQLLVGQSRLSLPTTNSPHKKARMSKAHSPFKKLEKMQTAHPPQGQNEPEVHNDIQ